MPSLTNVVEELVVPFFTSVIVPPEPTGIIPTPTFARLKFPCLYSYSVNTPLLITPKCNPNGGLYPVVVNASAVGSSLNISCIV